MRNLELTENHPDLREFILNKKHIFSTRQNKIFRWKLSFLYDNEVSFLAQFVKTANF